MTRSITQRARGRVRGSRTSTLSALVEAVGPELTFRAMAPAESVLTLVRQQDALCRAVVALDASSTTVEIERVAGDRGTLYRVLVRVSRQGGQRCATAEHALAEVAVRAAYLELARNLASAHPEPCSHAA